MFIDDPPNENARFTSVPPGMEQNHSSEMAKFFASPLSTGTCSGVKVSITSCVPLLNTKPPMSGTARFL